MVQCEMCGTETADPNRIKVEGAELDVCDGCTDFGTELQTDDGESSASTKYSTSSSSSSSTSSSGRSGSTDSSTTAGSGGGHGSDAYGGADELAQDFDSRIRSARERADMSQTELARELNEKASLIRKLERDETLPTDDLQHKLERYLDIDLSAGGDVDADDWDGDSSTGEYTLGDMVERKD